MQWFCAVVYVYVCTCADYGIIVYMNNMYMLLLTIHVHVLWLVYNNNSTIYNYYGSRSALQNDKEYKYIIMYKLLAGS